MEYMCKDPIGYNHLTSTRVNILLDTYPKHEHMWYLAQIVYLNTSVLSF